MLFLAAAWLALSARTADAGSVSTAPTARHFEATYVATVESVPAGLNRLEVWIPLPQDTRHQKIQGLSVESPYAGSIRREKENGNLYYYFSTDQPKAGKLDVKVRFDVERLEARAGDNDPTETPEDLQRYLQPDKLVTLSPRIQRLATQATLGHETPEAKARAIYDYVVNTMIYDKTAPGWGQGDTERACDVRKGNCTDFHSLFLSLARSQGIPARFVIGFPLKSDPSGTIPGYHCWAEFYIAGKGWIPVDASEASKSSDPAKRAYFFGHLDPDRVSFTTGRDLRLDPPPCAETLNYFIYPYAEGDGTAITPVAIRLEYRDEPGRAAGVMGGMR